MINTRKILFSGLALVFGTLAASAQIYTLTIDGTVTNSTSAYANPNDGFTATFVLSNPVAVPGAPGNSFEETLAGSADDSFQDTTTTGTHTTTTGEIGTAPDYAAAVTIFSGYLGYGHPASAIYGYQFNSNSTDAAPSTYQPGYEFWQLTVNLESSHSFVAPTGTLADLGNFNVSDLDEVHSFNLTLEQATYSNMVFTGYIPVSSEGGNVTSYTVQKAASSAPEPSTWALCLAGLVAIRIAVRRQRLA